MASTEKNCSLSPVVHPSDVHHRRDTHYSQPFGRRQPCENRYTSSQLCVLHPDDLQMDTDCRDTFPGYFSIILSGSGKEEGLQVYIARVNSGHCIVHHYPVSYTHLRAHETRHDLV